MHYMLLIGFEVLSQLKFFFMQYPTLFSRGVIQTRRNVYMYMYIVSESQNLEAFVSLCNTMECTVKHAKYLFLFKHFPIFCLTIFLFILRKMQY